MLSAKLLTVGMVAAALALSGTTGALAAPVRQAVQDAHSAQLDVSSGDMAQYQSDAEAFVTDLQVIRGDCLHGIR